MTESTLHLPPNPTLKDFQTYMKEMIKERGFDNETAPEVFMLFLEECGEMARAARKTQSMKSHVGKETSDLADEIGDVFIYLLDICNHYDIDLEKAFRDKEEKNKKRIWK